MSSFKPVQATYHYLTNGTHAYKFTIIIAGNTTEPTCYVEECDSTHTKVTLQESRTTYRNLVNSGYAKCTAVEYRVLHTLHKPQRTIMSSRDIRTLHTCA